MTQKKPLDAEEPFDEELVEDPRAWRRSLLELIPLSLIVIAVLLHKYDLPYSSEFFILGGSLAALLYLMFSWYMFKVKRYEKLEVVLSILCGLIFPVGILGLVFKIESWTNASTIMWSAIYAGGALLAVSLVLFVFHIRDERAATFYRNLLARLLVFCALLIRLVFS